MNLAVVATRRALCASCPQPCELSRAGAQNFHAEADLCASWQGRHFFQLAPPPDALDLLGGEAWPAALAKMRAAAHPTDEGMGDVIAREIGPICGEVFRAWYQTVFGRPCACTWDQSALNTRFPLA